VGFAAVVFFFFKKMQVLQNALAKKWDATPMAFCVGLCV
jgi:hypothetical protein